MTIGLATAAAVTAATVAAGPVATAAPAPRTAGTGAAARATVSKVAWAACDNPTLQQAGAVCGTVTVPLDYAKPKGATVHLAVSMVRHTVPDSQYQGIMLVNPGGPGGSGLTLSILGQFVPNGVGNAYDWIGFDPRGVGSSTPALSCIPDYFAGPRPLYEPFTKKIESAWLARSKAYAAACGKHGGALLQHLTTIDSARDMDAIRAALGQKQINYYGFSYGTYLGQVYATLFPHRVRRAVFDSNVDPRRVWYAANLDQDVAFERNMKIWFAWLAKYDAVYHLGKTERAVEARWYAERSRLLKHPAGGVVGASEWTDIFLYAGYYQQTWLDLADLWATWNKDHRNAQPLVDEYNSANTVGDDNGFAMYLGVQCVDAPWPRDWNVWRRDNWRTYQRAPFVTWGNAWFNAPCAFWPAKAHTPVDVDGKRVAPILLIDETLDAATPYPGSLEVRRRFPTSSLLAEPGGTSHADSLFGNACVDDTIAAYLANGTLPVRKPGKGPDATCAPLPVPVPPGVSSTSAASGSGAAAVRNGSPGAGRPALLLARLLATSRG